MSVLSQANRIKERLRACTTVAEVEAVAAEERDLVMSWNPQRLSADEMVKYLSNTRDERGLMFLHIVNLKKFMISGFVSQAKGRAA